MVGIFLKNLSEFPSQNASLGNPYKVGSYDDYQ